MGFEEQIQKIEVSNEELKKVADLGERALKLAGNRDFKAVILDGYFKDEAVRLSGLLGDGVSPQDEVMQALHAIAGLRRYLQKTVTLGGIATKEIDSNSRTLDELRQL